MDFNEKLQMLRKQKGLTQEELAEKLFVSRTAISKWESGRGYPSIDSLKAIARFYSVTIDELLSGGEVLTLAEEDRKRTEMRVQDGLFGLLDCGFALLFLLPLFGQQAEGGVQAVSLLAMAGVKPYLKAAYIAVTAICVTLGMLTLALKGSGCAFWTRHKRSVSLALHAAGVLLFIVGRQVYAAGFAFVLLLAKAWSLMKMR